MPLRTTGISAGTFVTILLLSNCGSETAACTPAGQSGPSQSGVVQESGEDRKAVIRLPLTNLAPVSAELTAPIGVADEDREILAMLESRRVSLDVREVPLQDVVDRIRDQVGCNILLD